MKEFIVKGKNVGFVCEHCGRYVPPAKGTIRNHCPFCLYSKHVDIYPGDRAEVCRGLMKPLCYLERKGQLYLKHKCTKCGTVKVNKVADDDNVDELFQLPMCLD